MKLLLIIAVLGVLSSCRSTRQIQTAITKKDTAQVIIKDTKKIDSAVFIKNILQQIEAKKIAFNSFTAKINVDYRGGDGKNYDVNASLRMLKDSVIWISVNAVLGIEAMRVLVTKDSVKLLNKLNKTYTARSIDYLQEVSKLPLDLYTLQELMIGNAVFLDSNVVSYSQQSGTISILSIGKWFKNLLTLNEQDKSILRSKMDDADITRSRTADLNYSDYENKKGPLFSTKRNITVTEKSKLEIKLDFKNYDFNEAVSFPFSVPKNYDRL